MNRIDTSRRGLLEGVTAIGALGVSAPDAAASLNPDAALIALCAEYMALEAQLETLQPVIHGDDDAAGDEAYSACEILWDRQHEIREVTLQTNAFTLAGLRARTQVTRASHIYYVATIVDQTFEEQANAAEKLVLAVLENLLALGQQIEAGGEMAHLPRSPPPAA